MVISATRMRRRTSALMIFPALRRCVAKTVSLPCCSNEKFCPFPCDLGRLEQLLVQMPMNDVTIRAFARVCLTSSLLIPVRVVSNILERFGFVFIVSAAIQASLGTNSKTNSSGEWFCTITSGSKGITFPAGIQVWGGLYA